MRCDRRWLALAALCGFTFLFWKVSESSSFSEDISLLVTVSLRARSLIVSTAPKEPRRRRLSGGLDGEVTMTEGPSPASASPLRRADPRMGDEPARVRSGILVNLIWFAGLCPRGSVGAMG